MASKTGMERFTEALEPSQPKEGLGQWLTLYRVLKPSVRESWFRVEDRIDHILHQNMPPMGESDRGRKHVGRLHEVYEYLGQALDQMSDSELRKLLE